MARKKSGKKRSFIFHDLWFEIIHALDAESTYELLMAIEKHHKGQEVELTNPVLLPSFMMIKAMMDEDSASYQETCEKRKKVAADAWEERKKKSENDANASKSTQKDANEEPVEIVTDESHRVPYQEIVNMYHEICVSLPTVRAVSDSRRKMIRSRYNQYGIDEIRTVFEKAEASDFLTGRTDKPWTGCGFDWLLKPSNFLKVLEGNYDNKGGGNDAVDTGNSQSAYYEELFSDQYI